MKSICILTFGTFCDIKLSLTVASYFLRKKTQVYFITNNVPETLKINDPNIFYIINDLDKYIDLKSHDIASKKINFKRLIKFTPLLRYINTTLFDQTKKILLDSDYIIVHYPALFLSNLLKDYIKSNKIGVFFVAPTYLPITVAPALR